MATLVVQVYENGRVGAVRSERFDGDLGRLMDMLNYLRNTTAQEVKQLSPRLAAIRDAIIERISPDARHRPLLEPFLQKSAIWETPPFLAMLEAISELKPPACPYCGARPFRMGVPKVGFAKIAEVLAHDGRYHDTVRMPASTEHGLARAIEWSPVFPIALPHPVPTKGHRASWCLDCHVEDPLFYLAYTVCGLEVASALRGSRYWVFTLRHIPSA